MPADDDMASQAPTLPSLADAMREACAATGLPPRAFTVQHRTTDPARLDTPGFRRDAAWFADLLRRFLPDGRAAHLRALHYLAASAADVLKPDGTIYRNDDADWDFLTQRAAKAGRWHGAVAWSRIVDERNAPPLVSTEPLRPATSTVDTHRGASLDLLRFDLPRFDPDALAPSLARVMPATTATVASRQPWLVSLWGEKASLGPMLGRIAADVGGEVVLPTGTPSDTLIADALGRATGRGQGLALIYTSDADPTGFAMPRETARKLQCLRHLVPAFAQTRIAVARAALTPAQAATWSLPTTPLKAEEKRGDTWRARWGREQTEIDAALALCPDRLEAVIRDVAARFHDPHLASRAYRSAWAWDRQAAAWRDGLDWWPDEAAAIEAARSAAMEAATTLAERLAALAPAVAALDAAREELDEARIAAARRLSVAARDALADGTLPQPEAPEPEFAETPEPPLFSSDDTFAAATLRLIADRDGDARSTTPAEGDA